MGASPAEVTRKNGRACDSLVVATAVSAEIADAGTSE
jgi:hypothetical protein